MNQQLSNPRPPDQPSVFAAIKTVSLWILAIIVFIVGLGIYNNYQRQNVLDIEQARRAALTPEQRNAEDQAAKDAAELAAKTAAEKKIADDLFEEKATALFACDELIKAASKDPSSVEYLYDATQAPITKRPDGRFDVQQKIRAKNSFGALTLNTVDCRISNSNGQWKGRIDRTF